MNSLGFLLSLAWAVQSTQAVMLEPRIPKELAPPGKQVVLFKLRAEGVNTFRVVPAAWTGGRTAYWSHAAGHAVLIDEEGQEVGTRADNVFSATDNSRFTASQLERIPAPDSRALPWQLLKAQDHQGKGRFSKVSFVQRVDTWSGQGTILPRFFGKVGTTKAVRFQATYIFYTEVQRENGGAARDALK